MDEHILQRWLAERRRGNVMGKSLHNIANELMPPWPFDAKRTIDQGRFTAKPFAQLFLKSMGIGRLQHDDIAANPLLHGLWRPNGDELAVMKDADTVTSFSVFHEVSGEQNRHPLLVP